MQTNNYLQLGVRNVDIIYPFVFTITDSLNKLILIQISNLTNVLANYFRNINCIIVKLSLMARVVKANEKHIFTI